MKRKILFVNDLIYAGGVEKVLYDIATGISQDKYDITIYTENNYTAQFKKMYPENIRYMSAKLINIPYRKNIIWKCMKKAFDMLNIIKKKIIVYRINKANYDICIAIKEGSSMQFVAEKINAEKKIAWVHVDYNYLYWTKYIFENANAEIECMKKFQSVVCVSEATKKSIIKTIGDPGNLVVKYNPVNVDEIIRQSLKMEIKRQSEVPLFVSVGRIVPQKGFENLLKACCLLEKEGYKYIVQIIGGVQDKKYAEYLSELIEKYNLKNINFIGEKQNPFVYERTADCYISSAIWESYGLAIQEAFVLDIPVIAASCPAIQEVFDYNRGWVVENSAEDLYKGMKSVLDNPQLLKEKKLNNSTMKTMFIERIKDIERLFEE